MNVKVEGLREFRKALRDSEGANPKQLVEALKAAGVPITPTMRSLAPKRTGELRASIGTPRASGTKGRIPVKARHALPVEFAKHGRFGATLTSRYGAPPRFGYRAVEKEAPRVIEILEKKLKEILTANGWMR